MSVRRLTVPAGVERSHIRNHTSQFADFVEAVKELVWNGFDYDATEISVRFEKSGGQRNLIVLDNGTGITDGGLQDVVSMDRSESAKDPNKRGLHGTGSKGGFHHCSVLSFQTRRRGEGELYCVQYTQDELMEMWKQEKGDWTIDEIPVSHPIRVSGTLVSMLGLGTGEGVNPRHDRSAQRIVSELGQRLPTHVAQMVTVIDEHGRSFKLKRKAVKGQKVEGEGHIPGIGAISYDIGVVKDAEEIDERLHLWAEDSICDIYAFLSRIRPTTAVATLLRSLRSFMEHPLVNGSITIPGLNIMTAEHNRHELKQEFYDDEDKIFSILRFCHEEILPKLEAILGKTSERVRKTDTETLRLELIRHLQELGGTPTSRTPIVDVDLDALKVTPARFEVEPGDQMSLEIASGKTGKTYQWDDKNSGGNLDRLSGPKVTFTAGAIQGAFSLSVTDGEKKVTIPIGIVAELPFGFSTSVRYAEPGQCITLRLQNVRRTSGQFKWNDAECGGKLTVSADTLSAEYEAGEEMAEFNVPVTEMNPPGNRLPKRAKCTIYIAPKKGKTEVRQPSDSAFAYPKEGPEYTLQLHLWENPESVVMASYLPHAIPGEAVRITLNLAHACFQGQTHRVVQQAAFTQIALRIAEHELDATGQLLELSPSMAITHLQSRASAILADLISRRAL